LDPGFPPFAAWCEAEAIPLVIVSDGVDYFIQRILARHRLSGLRVVSNRLERGAGGRRRLAHPWGREGCASGVGKCVVAATRQPRPHGETIVYVGDGRSDFC